MNKCINFKKNVWKNIIMMCFSLMLTSAMAIAQQGIAVTGTVSDESGPLPGANIVLKGTLIGVTSDNNGNFKITVPDANATLEFSFVGYINQEVRVGNDRVFNIKMLSSAMEMEEVVVIGYGVQRRSDITGSISSVRAADLENRSSSNAAAALQGKAAGIQVSTLSGNPGEASQIRIRGYSSNNGGSTSPLYVVDGLIVDNLTYLNPNVIESMEILKDAASAAIYGAQAGNGVVLVTTKKGQRGTGKIFYDYQLINNRLGRVPEVLNAKEFIEFKNLEGTPVVDTGNDIDWINTMYKPSNTTSHTIGFQGANEDGNIFLSINHVDDQGMVVGPYDFYKRLTAQLNAEYKIKPWLTVGSNNSIEKWERVAMSDRSNWNAFGMSVLRMSPLSPTHYPSDAIPADVLAELAKSNPRTVYKDPDNGLYYSILPESNYGSPFIMRERGKNNNQQGINVRGTFYLNFNPIKDITFTSRFGYRLNQGFNKNYTASYYAGGRAYDNNHSLSVTSSTGWYYQWENFINYNKMFGKHFVGAMAGMSYVQREERGANTTISGTDPLTGYTPNFLYITYASTTATRTSGETNNTFANMAYFGRLTWAYDNRYNVQANFRADIFDISKLPRGSWGYFPSFSAGWTLSNEAFMRDLANSMRMDNLKIRASWGKNGNVDALGRYQYNATIEAPGRIYYMYKADNNTATQGRRPSGLVRKDLKWETLVQWGIGFDTRFLNNRLSFTYDYFNKETRDILVNVAAHAEVGITSTTTMNAGSVLNKGHEVELGWRDKKGDFSYSINGNISFLNNEVTDLHKSFVRITGDGIMNGSAVGAFEVGKPVWYLRGFEFDRVAQTNGNYTKADGSKGSPYVAGDALFKDLNGDGAITSDDLTMIGTGIPDMTFGVTVNLAYKNFDLSIFGSGVSGNRLLLNYYDPGAKGLNNVVRYYYEDCWSSQNTNGTKPFPGTASVNNYHSSSASTFKGDFFRIKQIQLGYSIPQQLLNRVYVNNLRIFISLDDFFTITKYPGFDPEASSMNLNSGISMDRGNVPISKKVMFGLNVSF